jgi:2,4-dienoyl-CoA reductase-like NADH-dependent reductase (Old Yellow Enzyme family)
MNRNPSFVSRSLACAALAGAVLAGTANAQTATAVDPTQAFDAAMAAYERNHWVAAYAAFTALADAGHGEAARMALQMWRYGPALYRTSFAADPLQLERWSRAQRCDGEPGSQTCRVAQQTR